MSYPERVIKSLDRGAAHIAVNNPQLAIPDLEKVVAKTPKAVEGWAMLGQARSMLNEYAESERCYRKAMLLNPKNYEILFGLGLALSSQGKYQDATIYYLRAIDVARTDPINAVQNLASCHLESGNFAEAAEIYLALARQTDNGNFWALLGMARQGQAQYKEALNAYQCALERGWDACTLNIRSSECARLMGDGTGAIQYAQSALTVSPDNPAAQACLELANTPVP